MHGGALRVVTIDVATALDGDWQRRFGSAEVVRVGGVAPRHWHPLRAAGFTVKPAWITWGAPLRGTEEEFLAALPVAERRNVRASQRAADAAGTAIGVVPLSAQVLARFLPVYDAHIAGMPNGVPYARQHRLQLLRDRAAHVAVLAHQDGELVGGCICRVHPEHDLIKIAFTATRPQARAARLTRALHMAAAQHGRDLGLGWVSLGSDPALYGDLTMPGLFTFKARLGFAPIPIRCFDPSDIDAPDIAEAVLSLRTLNDPALSLGYCDPQDLTRDWHWAEPPPWHLQVLSTRPDVDVRPFQAPFVRHCTTRLLPGPADTAPPADTRLPRAA
jgi:GNAT superfamily N-acetyltransferase